MIDLTDGDLLRVWETMRESSLPRRAAALLALAMPELTPVQLADLSLGEAERRLLGVHRGYFGPQLACVADCAACAAPFEFAIDARQLEESLLSAEQGARPTRLEHDGYHLEIRSPNMGDCMTVADAGDAEMAYRQLLRRCLTGISRDGATLSAEVLPDTVLQATDEYLQAEDPAQELLLALACPTCNRPMTVPIDVAAFCWAEIEARVPRLLSEVHLLASRYGWREADILAMSRVRRDHYLAMVMA